jgi:hypothetical protein
MLNDPSHWIHNLHSEIGLKKMFDDQKLAQLGLLNLKEKSELISAGQALGISPQTLRDIDYASEVAERVRAANAERVLNHGQRMAADPA